MPRLWSEKLRAQLKPEVYFNFGITNTGPAYVMQKIKKIDFLEDDIVVTVLSIHDVNKPELIDFNLKNQNYIHNLPAKTIVLHVNYSEKLSHPYTFPFSLLDISWNEIDADRTEIKKRRWDKRINHLSWCNHDVLFDCILDMIDGNNKFTSDRFHKQFLSLDKAYHSDLYDGLSTFIYD